MSSINIDKLSSLKTIMGMKYIYPVYNVFILRVLMYPKTCLGRIVQLTQRIAMTLGYLRFYDFLESCR